MSNVNRHYTFFATTDLQIDDDYVKCEECTRLWVMKVVYSYQLTFHMFTRHYDT